ncbi:hypothetical protein SAMN05444392_11437 [Seinonella peptonophila]|uniref:Uncharacterized protein n=1 Tax=Seinonella peptonophila TaxID=112248 RepID=A0A1M5AIY4_9BACL|nr:hypothetical protein [Seinonella peptonophila]SHF30280.1 hypothetical protein SAMN05444392_11437 [Seinonella peptonophila]
MSKFHKVTMVFMATFCLLTFSGCSVISSFADRFTSAEQVAHDSMGELKKTKGYQSVAKGNETQTLIHNQKKTVLHSQYHFQESYSFKPVKIHSIRQYITNGHTVRSELYYSDGTVYQKTGISGWQKEKGTIEQLNLNYRPDQLLQAVTKGSAGKGIQGRFFVLEIGKAASKEYLTQAYHDFLSAFQQATNVDPKAKVSIQTDRLSERIFIDRQTKRLHHIELNLKLSTKLKEIEFSLERKGKIELTGDLQQPILLPDYVKKDAISHEMEEEDKTEE